MQVVAALVWCVVLAAVPALAQTTSTSTNSSTSTSTSLSSTTSTSLTSTTSTSVPCMTDCRQVAEGTKDACRSCVGSCFQSEFSFCTSPEDAGGLNPGCGEGNYTTDDFTTDWLDAGAKWGLCVTDTEGNPNLFLHDAPSSCRRNRSLQGSCYKVARRNPRRCSIVQTCVDCCSTQLNRRRRLAARRLMQASVNAAREAGESVAAVRKACRVVIRCARAAQKTADAKVIQCDNTPNCIAPAMGECVDTVKPLGKKFTKENTLSGCYASCSDKCGENEHAYRQCRRACRDLLCSQWTDALSVGSGPCETVLNMCSESVTTTTVPGTTSTTLPGTTTTTALGSTITTVPETTSTTLPGTTTTTVAGMSMAAARGFCLLGCNDFESCSELPTTTSSSTSSSVTTTSSTSTTIFSAVRRNRKR